jgi:hypothetical protein
MCLTLSLMPRPAVAQNRAGGSEVKKRVHVQVGKPSIWSVGQAHYQLAGMRRDNRALKTLMPDVNDLDPNGVNASSIRIVRTLLDMQAQFDQRIGILNQSALNEQQVNLRRRDEARRQLAARQNELDEVNARIEALNITLARLRKENEQRKAEREEDETQPTDEDRLREIRIAGMEQTLEARRAEKTALEAQITTLDTRANAAVAAPSLTATDLGSAPTSGLPDSDALKAFITNAFKDRGKPNLAASIALDNYIGMQYEIIAKQLTLLRDELGRDERLIFLELPSSIYTVPSKADDYMVQVRWTVSRYVDDVRGGNRAAADGGPRPAAALQDDPGGQRLARSSQTPEQGVSIDFNDIEAQWVSGGTDSDPPGRNRFTSPTQEGGDRRETYRFKSVGTGHADSPDNGAKNAALSEEGFPDRGEQFGPAAKVRALDIIPRQSALNINEDHATANRKNFLGVLKLISGFGLRLDYQKQQELYDQFLQQNVFASGFGKGAPSFGWTFAPLPGTNRIAPGVRTTYAVLAVPANTSALEISGQAIAYPRKRSPDFAAGSEQLVASDKFLIRVPNKYTENFQVEEITYTPVKKGQRATAILRGDYFSPQAGVLINGVPLKRALSIADNESADAQQQSTGAKGVTGEYEHLSSHEILINFSMGDSYMGTPIITLVTPEKSSALNYFHLRINNQDGQQSLQERSMTEPMFLDAFSVEKKLSVISTSTVQVGADKHKFVHARLKGTGLLPGAEVWVGSKKLPPLTLMLEERLKEKADEIEKLLRTSEYRAKVRTETEREAVSLKSRLRENLLSHYEEKLSESEKQRLIPSMRAALREEYASKKEKYTEAEIQARAADKAAAELLKPEIARQIKKQAGLLADQHINNEANEVALEIVRGEAVRAVEATLTARFKEEVCREEGKTGEACNGADIVKEAARRAAAYGQKPFPTDEYSMQESTGAYLVNFDSTGMSDQSVRYVQPTREGLDMFETPKEPPAPAAKYELKRYIGNAEGRAAMAEFRIVTTVASPQFSLGEGEGTLISSKQEEENTYRVAFFVSDEKLGNDFYVKRDKVTLTVSGAQGAVKSLDVTLPVRAQISSITNPRTGKAEGFADEEAVVLIRGANLHNVTHVYFGDAEATIVGTPSYDLVRVKTPKRPNVTKGEAVLAPVSAVTDSPNSSPALSTYTFIGAP